MYIASPFILQTGTSQQAQLFQAAMKKWAAPGTLIDSPSVAGFATVMNVQAALSKVSGASTTTSIEAAFKTGSNHPNFLSHPYTCDGQQMTGALRDLQRLLPDEPGQERSAHAAERDRLDHLEGLLQGPRALISKDRVRRTRPPTGGRVGPA